MLENTNDEFNMKRFASIYPTDTNAREMLTLLLLLLLQTWAMSFTRALMVNERIVADHFPFDFARSSTPRRSCTSTKARRCFHRVAATIRNTTSRACRRVSIRHSRRTPDQRPTLLSISIVRYVRVRFSIRKI